MKNSAKNRLHDLLEGFDTVMLITHITNGGINARPMAVVEMTDAGQIIFFTAEPSDKVKEIKKDSDVTLVFQNKMTFVSLNGTAEVTKDRAMIEELWSEDWSVWFPDGKNDPNLRLLKVTPVEAEYWDNSGVQGISYAFKAAKAYIKGETPEITEDIHGKISL